MLETLTYSYVNPSDLREVTTKLEEIIVTFRNFPSQKALSYDHKQEKQPEKELKRSAGSTGLFLTL